MRSRPIAAQHFLSNGEHVEDAEEIQAMLDWWHRLGTAKQLPWNPDVDIIEARYSFMRLGLRTGYLDSSKFD